MSIVSSDVNPDRSSQYQLVSETEHGDSVEILVLNKATGRKQKLIDQLNENWRQLRLLRTAVADRDTIIGTLHESIRTRDQAVKALKTRVKISNKVWPLVYAAIGAICAKGLELLVIYNFFGAVK